MPAWPRPNWDLERWRNSMPSWPADKPDLRKAIVLNRSLPLARWVGRGKTVHALLAEYVRAR